MSETVFLSLLGAPKIAGGEVLPLSKSTALLAYLAIKHNWVPRQELIGLFYPNSSQEAAQNNLRQLLSRTKTLAVSSHLEIEAKRLRLLLPCDLNTFYASLEQPEQAVQHNGELLQGLDLPDAPNFMAWLESERLEHQTAWRTVALRYAQTAPAPEALLTWRQILKTHPLCEEAVQGMLRHANRDDALAVYARFAELLHLETKLEPNPETQQLLSRLQTCATPHNLPFSSTPFLGRVEELAKLQAMLEHPFARLVTVVGLGGMGKTRLALQAAAAWLESGLDGVYVVPLADIENIDNLPSAIAGALGLRFHDDAVTELLAFLRPKRLILILDNFEHLDVSGGFVRQMLEQCGQVKLLVTSRVPLEVYGQWLLDLHGFDDHNASQLFVQTAKRFAPQFRAEENILRLIVQYLGGMPLAIELAAYWTRLLSLSEIMTELTKGLKLESTSPAIPERQRAVGVLLRQSFERLSPLEQQTLFRFTPFRGGATLEAARAVTGASLEELQHLQDCGLLRFAAQRFEMHELLRQFVRAQMSDLEWQDCLARHGNYFCQLIVFASQELQQNPLPTIARLSLEYPNAEIALPYFVRFDLGVHLESFADIFMVFLRLRGLFAYAIDLLHQTLQDPTLTPVLRQQNQLFLAMVRQQTKQFDASRLEFEALLPNLSAKHPFWGMAQLEYAIVWLELNQPSRAYGCFQAALEAFVATGSSINIVRAHLGLALCGLALGLPETQAHAQAAINTADQEQIRFIDGTLYGTVGRVFWALQLPEAQGFFERALGFYLTVGDTIAAQNLRNAALGLGVRLRLEADNPASRLGNTC